MKPAMIVGVVIACVIVAGIGGYLLLKPKGPSEQPAGAWVKEGVLISGGYCDPEVVALPDGRYRMSNCCIW